MAAQSESRRLTAALLLAVALAATLPCFVGANENPERSQAEARLKQVLGEITQLQENLSASRREHGTEQARLKQLDLAIQDANITYRALENEKQVHEQELEALQQQRAEYLDSLDERLAQLAVQVRDAYRAGHQSRMKLVLNQDDPTRIGRMLAYYDFVNRAQVAKISGLKEALSALDAMQQSIDQELARIANVQLEQEALLDELGKQRDQRQQLLATLAGQIGTGEAQLKELEQNRADLQALIERLADILADIPDDLGNRPGVQQQKGRLPMPLAGPVRHAFGQSRPGGLSWQGWLIAAEPGTEVKSVAYGRVAFADWLRGYGLLLIIDHGQDFMTLYGHNEVLLQEAGSWVEAGEPIGTVGSNPGNDQGVYFELRKKGKAVDPAAWLAR